MRTTLAAIAAAALVAGTAAARVPSPAPTTEAPASAKATVARTAKSLECSEQADARGVQGKPRKGFTSDCK